ncbi:hypothetical protein M5689_006562 [Euphorbia peplus]|nr:hypothetical protein M5689_006562 [Euphorbia peplus]
MGRITWDDEKTRKLLTTLAEAKDKGTSKFSWPCIAKLYNAHRGCDINAKQASNHFSDLKDKFKSLEELQCLTGIAYDHTTSGVDVWRDGMLTCRYVTLVLLYD